MAILNRKSVLFLKSESTAGTPAPPTAAGDAVALQDGFSLVPDFEVLENAELKASIGSSKDALGLENPSLSMDHYLRHSGVEGTEPNYGLLLESAMGSKAIRGTERDVVSATAGTAAARATITVDTGEGTEFPRGSALLIKDGTNGFEIRAVESVSGDVLDLSFNLSNAPAAAVNLGLGVDYSPSESDPTFSAWEYRGNGGAIELIAGNRVESMELSFIAGEYINGSFTSQGTEYFFNPLTVDATNDSLDFDDAGGEENASITQQTYKHPHELAQAIEDAMNALTADNITVTYSDVTGKYTIASDGATLSLLWNTGTNTATTIGSLLGFSVAADDTGATSYEGDNAITLAAPFTPSLDSESPLVAKDNELFIGDFDDFACISARSVVARLANTIEDVEDICAASGLSEKAKTQRVIEIDVVANLTQYEADFFRKFAANSDVSLQYNFGVKSGGNWVAGRSGLLYMPTGTITSFELAEQNSTVVLNMTLKAFVNANGDGEFYIGFV